ncbi:DUF3035 domain-containing protein [uncultured Brevundimonas sp.]|uniref:DUF3035 domain-containing protein n=1 Tax=uncultured Brevundimonas sp. TaxID=213418 RepID=UPI00261113DB|nr:DUF3035 domain-containing protein [uncultured Brevundimonas sp.]
MRIRTVLTLTIATSAMLSLGACSSIKQGIGLTKVTPDEFLTVSSAPLVVPPEYGLTPPSPGAPRPQELAPESAARQILLGQRQAITRSQGEQALVANAGGDRADPLASYVVDNEFGDLTRKEEGWANRLIFWRRDQPSTQGTLVLPGPQGQRTIDITTEQGRREALTGGREGITIAPRRDTRRFKLPGL